MLRLRRLNAANKASDLQRLVQRVVNMEQRKLRRTLPSRVGRRNQNMVARQQDNEARSKLQGKVNRIRHRVTINVYDSARRRLWPQVNTGNAAVVSRLDFGNRSRRLLAAEPRVRRAANEKKCRALTLSRLRHNSTSSRSTAAPRPQPITARDKGNRKVERRDNQKKRHRHGRNNFGAITPAAPEVRKFRSRFFRTGFLL